MMTYELITSDGRSAIKCLRCGLTSHNSNDVEQLFCGNCHRWHTEERIGVFQERVRVPAGIVNLPTVFREIAKKANAFGLQGFEVLDVEYGLDIQKAKRYLLAGQEVPPDVPVYVTITYRKLA